MNRDPPKGNFFSNLFLSGISAALAQTVIKPLLTIKFIRLDSAAVDGLSNDNSNIFPKYLKNEIKEKGFSTLWRNNVAEMTRSVPIIASNFAFKELYTKFFLSMDHDISLKDLPVLVRFLSGGLAGATVLTFSYPLDVPKVKIVNDIIKYNMSKQPQSFSGRLKRIIGSEGLYKGFSSALLGVTIYRTIYFGGYDTIKEYISSKGKEVSVIADFILARTIVALACFLTYPINVIRKRMMLESLGTNEPYYKGSIDCVKKTIKEDGAKHLIRGVWWGAIIGPRNLASSFVLVSFDRTKAKLFAGSA